VERLSDHVSGFLVGSALMRSARPAEAARELVFGRVKLCGLTNPEDIRTGRAATFAGLVFVPGSPRHLTAEQAAPLAGLARCLGLLPVGIFQNAPLPVVADIATLLNLHAVQLHGSEDFEFVRSLRRQLPRECGIWTAASVGRGPLSSRGGDRILFDSGSGGTGRTFDWDLVRHHPDLPSALVAGGIGPGNARSAAGLGGFAIDVGSALDVMPGMKSPVKTRALFEARFGPVTHHRSVAPCRSAGSRPSFQSAREPGLETEETVGDGP